MMTPFLQCAFIRLTAAVFFGYGVLCLLFPAELFYWLTQSNLDTQTASIDVRATYGGMSAAIGILLYLLTRGVSSYQLGLQSVLVLMIAMASGRSLGMLVDGGANTMMWIYLALEIGAALFAGLLLKSAD